MKIQFLIFSILLIVIVGSALVYCGRKSTVRWMIYYGQNLDLEDLKGIEIAILDADEIDVNPFKNKKNRFFGYLSVGEAENYRGHWPFVLGKDFIVEKNEEWGSFRVDIRSEEWRALLISRVIPEILKKGYDGLFFDTVDTALYLERKDPDRFKGSVRALIDFIREVKKQFPDIGIIVNNGLELLPVIGSDIAAVCVEDLYTRYDFNQKKSFKTPEQDRDYKEKYLDEYMRKFRKPVLNILYEESNDSPLARYSIERSESKNYSWYLTTVDLKSLGTPNP